MRLHKAKRAYGCEISIAPLIDVVFLLIIFFMTISQIAKVEVDKLSLPEAKEGRTATEAPAGRIVVNIHRDGRIVVGGRALSIASLRGILAAELEGKSTDEVSVLVRGDRDSNWQEVARVMDACAAQGIHRVRVAVLEPEAGGPAL
jgi:biopolymer transport protein ExbD